MTTLTVTAYVSLDGVVQAPGTPTEDPRDGFDLGGWLYPHYDAVMAEYAADWFSRADAFLLGRRTYEIFAGYWPSVGGSDPIAGPLNTLPKYVASRTLTRSSWQGTAFLRDDVVAAVAELKAEPGRELQVHGSGDLLRTLMAADLVDEYRLWVFPVVLGRGRRLFPPGAPSRRLRLTEHRETGKGVSVQVYRTT
ncbi:dihydrofolate reductase family protein [Amycolatopsis sp. FDAARGOS 1241]|uniref:dihydrofolate reductase family protein n=1 Tax=Amycolatopsis sp. FDAARGOS 1241 TaxID=2778070 RepID=UPI00194FE264|nr:dihydrofolate reductase family protein [Amycolatopsis sp. FDAARGOS 1241]QRP46433.1 dihydrofolate reductase family protein [Amycolatopsis sp. FDAARGOS 1241]